MMWLAMMVSRSAVLLSRVSSVVPSFAKASSDAKKVGLAGAVTVFNNRASAEAVIADGALVNQHPDALWVLDQQHVTVSADTSVASVNLSGNLGVPTTPPTGEPGQPGLPTPTLPVDPDLPLPGQPSPSSSSTSPCLPLLCPAQGSSSSGSSGASSTSSEGSSDGSWRSLYEGGQA